MEIGSKNLVGSKAARAAARWLTLVFTISLFMGCGSVLSTAEINDARDAIERAAVLDAEAYATYEFVSADAYLDKAEEEWGRSDFQKSVEYARRAQQFAEMAYQRAMRHPDRAAPAPAREGSDVLQP